MILAWASPFNRLFNVLCFLLSLILVYRSSPLCTNSGTHMYPESTTLITEIEATGVQLKAETYIQWSIALMNVSHETIYMM